MIGLVMRGLAQVNVKFGVGSITSLHTDALLAGDVLAPAPTAL